MDILLVSEHKIMANALSQHLGDAHQVHVPNDPAFLSEVLDSIALSTPMIDFCLLDLSAKALNEPLPPLVSAVDEDADTEQTLFTYLAYMNHQLGLPLVYINSKENQMSLDSAMAAGGDDSLPKEHLAEAFTQKLAPFSRWAERFRRVLGLQDELVRHSRHDTVTQLPNARGFNQELVRNWCQMKREQSALGLILLDIDDYQNHQTQIGQTDLDDAVRTVALLLEGSLSRPLDAVFRLSDTCFAVLLPKTDGQGAMKVAQAAMRHVKEANISMGAASQDEADIMTLSVAAVSFTPEQLVNQNTQALPRLAENLLMQAKAEGGDRILASEATRQVGEPS